MKLLETVLSDIKIVKAKGDSTISISELSLSSRAIAPGGAFIALVGTVTDGHMFIPEAIASGARVIVHEQELSEYHEAVTYVQVEDTHEALGIMARNFYDNPSRKFALVGVTGTNGKTTTATLLHQLFLSLGHKAGMIGTVVNKINDTSFEATRTTPDAITLQALLERMVEAGCTHCFMEVSSHAVSEKRIAGLTFAGGIFTNLTLDHLDYHKTMEAYRDAKKGFFDMLDMHAFALANRDDSNGEYMLSTTKASTHFYALKSEAEFAERLTTKLIGEFNAYNALAIYGAAILLGEESGKVKECMKTLEPVEGRFNYSKSTQGITGIVDYAHTPDALENVLRTTLKLRDDMSAQHPTAKIISLFGCGGDRDKSKRPIMARIAYDMSDIVILTTDNPRTEKPEDILADMKKGIEDEDTIYPDGTPRVLVITDRATAIAKACELATPGDYILLAGKGHEKYQEVNGSKSHFDDMEELKKYLI